MTVIEQRTMDAIQSINRKMRDQHEPDWEQRRYEIAKEVMGTEASNGAFSDDAAKYAVACADALITELKKGQSK